MPTPDTNTLDQDSTVERKYQIAGYAIDRWYDDPDPQALHQHVEDLVEEFNITALELWPAVAVLLAELYVEEAIHAAAEADAKIGLPAQVDSTP